MTMELAGMRAKRNAVDARSAAVLDQMEATIRETFDGLGICRETAIQAAVVVMYALGDRATALEQFEHITTPTRRAVHHCIEEMMLALSGIEDNV
jgi:hypothetical protein